MRTRGIALALLMLAAPTSAQQLGPADVEALPAVAPNIIASYGPDPLQTGDLRLPRGKGPFPVAVVIHGGCWTKGFATKRTTAALATALTRRGYATWNIEYRQVGDIGGGWPGTFKDWAAATDYLRTLARSEPLSLKHTAVIGHSAGGFAALWIASRSRLPVDSEVGSPRPLPIETAISIDGAVDLPSIAPSDLKRCGRPVVAPLMGGTVSDQPARYQLASPMLHFPHSTHEFLIASAGLANQDAQQYRTAAQRSGQTVRVLAVRNGGHFDVIAPGSMAWTSQVEPFIARALGKHRGRDFP